MVAMAQNFPWLMKLLRIAMANHGTIGHRAAMVSHEAIANRSHGYA